MAETTTGEAKRLPGWFPSLCDKLWRMQRAFWTLFGLGVLASVLAFLFALQWPFTSNKSLNGTFIGWCFHNSLLLLFIGLFYLALFGIVYIGHHYHHLAQTIPASPPVPITPVPVSTKTPEQLREEQKRIQQQEAERRYLQHMINETRDLNLTGIPAGLLSPGVQLDEVFIPLQFTPNPPPSDYPLPPEERNKYKNQLERGEISEEIAQVLFEAEKDWQRFLQKVDKISLADLWKRLTEKYPAAIIQGEPGIGKSTLMDRLTLHMARRGKDEPDLYMLDADCFDPPLIPLLIRLKRYADACDPASDLSIEEYVTAVLATFAIPEAGTFIRQSLQEGRCLVMFDGLDEISNPKLRQHVQEAIKTFISNHRYGSSINFNRFLITSRIAGYDQYAFSNNFLYFTVAKLIPQQINDFLPRWCQASVRWSHANQTPNSENIEQEISREAQQLANALNKAMKENQGVRELAENPLLLTLLAVMQQNSIELPRQRVDLYSKVTEVFLENRNIAKGLPQIPVDLAIRRLGPLALTMQETKNNFARRSDVLTALKKAISDEGGTPEQVDGEAENFLKRIRERGGLFVQRTGDYFSFMHRTFQEYFVARHILNEIQQDQAEGITKLIQRVQRDESTWREPFLLAVAYQSNENKKIASEIVRQLSLTNTPNQPMWDHLLLAADSVIESSPNGIEPELQKSIAHELLASYEERQSSQDFQRCSQIEARMRRWLLSISVEAYQPSALIILCETITDFANIPLQRATLTMLAMIAQNLADCPPNVFAALIPPLLALAGLPAVGNHRPAQGVAASANLDVADLALTVLSFLGKPGPSGLLLADVRRYFKDKPDHLRLLARYSLEHGTLITPCVIPLTEENYRRYEEAIAQWIALRDSPKTARISEQAIDSCLCIHQSLLDWAEEVTYPTATLLLALLAQSAAQPEQSWQEIWKNSLERELAAKSYISYQQAGMLWTTLFIDETDQRRLARLLLDQYNNAQEPLYRYALRFFTNIMEDLRYLRYIRYIRDLRYLRDLIFTQDVTEKAKDRLSSIVDRSEQVDLLSILLGRALQIVEVEEKGKQVESEVEEIVQRVYPTFTATSDGLVREAALDILRYLPSRSASEIRYVLNLAEQTIDQQIWQACARALRYANPETEDAWTALEVGKRSQKKAVREAVEERIRRR